MELINSEINLYLHTYVKSNIFQERLISLQLQQLTHLGIKFYKVVLFVDVF